MIQVTIGAASDPGQKRKENQDSHSYRLPEEGSSHRKGILLALADGMGGHSGGSVASQTAIEALMETYYTDMSSSITESLEKSFLKANERVIEKGKSDIDLHGLGSTLTAAVLKDDKMYYAHVGDSRGYIIYDKKITQFTEDHSYVASLLKAGVINEEEALTHPDGNIITRAIGADENLNVDVSPAYQKLKKNQYILLCCDGLYRVVTPEEITDTVYAYQDPEAISQKLVEMANAKGGPDNITVLIARIDGTGNVSGLIDRFKSLIRDRA
jgi:protein phosphatase